VFPTKEEIIMHGYHGCRGFHMMGPHDDMIMHGMKMHGIDHHPELCGRHFFSDEEKAELLQKYKEWLDKESKGVQEMLEKLGKE
jgi:hypothetical protein